MAIGRQAKLGIDVDVAATSSHGPVDGPAHPFGPMLLDLQPHGVSQSLDRVPVRDAVARKVQRRVQLVQRHRTVQVQQRDTGLPQELAAQELCVRGQRRQGRSIGARRSASATPAQLRPQQLVDLHGVEQQRSATVDELGGLLVRGAELSDDAGPTDVDRSPLGVRERGVEAELVVRIVLDATWWLGQRRVVHRAGSSVVLRGRRRGAETAG